MSVMAAYLTEVGSAYINDSRVTWIDDAAILHDPVNPNDSRAIGIQDGGWVALGLTNDDATIHDEGAWYAARQWVPKVFPTLDSAIDYIIGEPQ